MLVIMVAVLEALFYLCSIPVKLAVKLDGFKAGTQLSVFGTRLKKGGGKGPDVTRVLKVLRRIRFERLEVRGRICMGDAAATALLCGGMTAALKCLPARRKRVNLTPDFTSDHITLHLNGMLRARSGQIILAMLKVWIEDNVIRISNPAVEAIIDRPQ